MMVDNEGPLLYETDDYYVMEEQEGMLDFNVGLPLTGLLPVLNSDTVDEQLSNLSKQNEVPRRGGPPDRTSNAGEYNFQVEINGRYTNKHKFLFSHKLNRIYVDMDTDFPVQFTWRGPAQMCVRATCAFADDAQAEKRVERCLSHFHSSTCADPVVSRNVLHSSRPPGTAGIQYCGEPHSPDSWLSVLVSLHKPQAEVSHAYRFTCKSSCTSGINRRAILIIFTLEDHLGNVHGRQVVGARVCSCARRDMTRDEETEGVPKRKRRVPAADISAQTPPATKVKREDLSEHAIDINLQVLSPAAAILGVQVMLKMEQQAYEARQEPRALDIINSLKIRLQELKEKYPEHAE